MSEGRADKKVVILIVEDDREIVTHLEALLIGEGFGVRVAFTRQRALEILEKEAGTQFDPRLVPVFVDGMRAGRIQMAGETAGAR